MKRKIVYANVYQVRDKVFTGCFYTTRKKAKLASRGGTDLIGTIEINLSEIPLS